MAERRASSISSLELGYHDLTVLDVSQEGLRTTRQRIGADRDKVQWLQLDITEFDPRRQWDLWHDRAVFHFLTDPEQRIQYRKALERAVPSGGHVIIATFAMTGPERCSGQFVMRYDAEAMQAELGDRYELSRLGPSNTKRHRERRKISRIVGFGSRSMLGVQRTGAVPCGSIRMLFSLEYSNLRPFLLISPPTGSYLFSL